MKNAITCLFLLASVSSTGQTKREALNANPGFKIEFSALPAIFQYQANIGFSYKSAGALEHKLRLGSYFRPWMLTAFNLNVSYNLNTYFSNKKNYIPAWFKVSNTRREIGYEEGYYPHTLRFSVGTGFGRLFRIGEKWGLRTEIGAGVLLNLTDASGKILTLDLNLSEYSFDQYYPDQYPHFLPAFRFHVAFVRVLGKSKP